MIEFLQSYGILILIGVMIAFMFIRRGSGHSAGCGMGCGHQTREEKNDNATATEKTERRQSGGCH